MEKRDTNPQLFLSGAMLVASACLLLESKSVPHVSELAVRPWVLRSSSNMHSQNSRMLGPGRTLENTRAHRSFIYKEACPREGRVSSDIP